MAKQVQQKYDESSIVALEGLEAIRLRPGMYVADTGAGGVLQLAREVIDNAVDEYQAGANTYLKVEVWTKGEKRNQVRVTDSGRGVPVKKHPKLGIPTITAIFSRLHTGGKFEGKYGGSSSGLHGVGVKATNALSEFLIVTVQRDGGKFQQKFSRGEKTSEVTRLGDSSKTGTVVHFKHDQQIFRGIDIDPEAIQERLEEVAYLCPGLQVVFVVDGHEREVTKEGGLKQFLRDRLALKHVKLQHAPVYVSKDIDLGEEKGGLVTVELAFAWTQDSGDHWYSFVNVCSLSEGGTQVTGMKRAVAAAFSKLVSEKIDPDFFRDGLYVASHVRLANPIFKSQAKVRLLNTEVGDPSKQAMAAALKKAFAKFEDLPDHVIERARMLKAQREKLAKAMETVRRLDFKVKKRGVLPGKLKECPMASPKERELYLVEGDSAGSQAAAARDSRRQEVLCLRGKVINAARSEPSVVFKNNEFISIVAAIGCGVDNIGAGEDEGCDPTQRGRIQAGGNAKVCIMTDADPDGQHICALLIAFFVRYMRPLIENGLVYVVDSPLFVGVHKDRREHGATKKEVRKKFGKGIKPVITYLKGHGEASSEQLEDYAFGPNRKLWRLTIEDDSDVDGVQAIMGVNGDARKKLLGLTA